MERQPPLHSSTTENQGSSPVGGKDSEKGAVSPGRLEPVGGRTIRKSLKLPELDLIPSGFKRKVFLSIQK